MSVRVVERLGWRRRGAPTAICADLGRMTPVMLGAIAAREGAAAKDVRRDSRLSGTRVPADCLT